MVQSALKLVAMIGAFAGAAPAVAAQDIPDSAEVRTSGTAVRTIPPDLATLTVQLSAMGESPSIAMAAVAERARAIRDALVRLGIPRDSLVTGGRWYWWRGRVETVPITSRCNVRSDGNRVCAAVDDTTYRARDAIQVRTRDLGGLGALIDTLVAHGATDISPITFTATDSQTAADSAAAEATVIARRQATAIATASGGRLGRVVSLSTQPAYTTPYWGLDSIVVTGAANQAATGTEIKAPSVTVRVTVYGVWRIEQE
jgi:uncharacterized protein